MGTRKSIALFIAAAVAEIGGAWLIWQGVREHRGWIWSSLAASRYSTGSGTTSRSSA
jgi:drug/metabolite transporter superfamily protein YnfA